jgi:hypothetical protein
MRRPTTLSTGTGLFTDMPLILQLLHFRRINIQKMGAMARQQNTLYNFAQASAFWSDARYLCARERPTVVPSITNF